MQLASGKSLPSALYIGGDFTRPAAGGCEAIINPATEESIGVAPVGDLEDVQAAIQAARNAFDHGPWPHLRTRDRAATLEKVFAVLMANAERICDLIVAEAGAVKSNARARQFDIPMKHFRYYLDGVGHDGVRALGPELTPGPGGTAVGTAFVVREPVGVVAAITPYNYPYFLNLAKVVPALLTGNTVVLKPSPYTPFGGVKRSGYGRELGEEGLNEFTQLKLIEIQAG